MAQLKASKDEQGRGLGTENPPKSGYRILSHPLETELDLLAMLLIDNRHLEMGYRISPIRALHSYLTAHYLKQKLMNTYI